MEVTADKQFFPNDIVIARGRLSRKYGVNGMMGMIIEMPGVPPGEAWKWVEFGEREIHLPIEELNLKGFSEKKATGHG